METNYRGAWGDGERLAVRLVRGYLAAAGLPEELVAFGARCCELDLPSTATIAGERKMSGTHAEHVRRELRAFVLAPEQGQLQAALIHEAAHWLTREPTRTPAPPRSRGEMRGLPPEMRRRAFRRAGLSQDESDLAELVTEREPLRCEAMLRLLPGWSRRRFERTREGLLLRTRTRKCGQLPLALLHLVVGSELASLLEIHEMSTPLGGPPRAPPWGPPEGGRQIPNPRQNPARESRGGAR